MAGLPQGTVTFLFTDIEGSTRLLKQLGERYGDVLEQHRRILRDAVEARDGREVDTQGDSFFFAFARANAALGAAVAAQRELASHEWPEGVELRVRMGLHTGEPAVGAERYVGLGVHRAARIGAVAHGGQVLLSSATRELVEDEVGGVSVRELGSYRLKDLDRPERLFQLDIGSLQRDFPPLNAEKVAAPRPLRRRALLLSALAGVLAAAVAIPIFAVGGGAGGSQALAAVGASSVGMIDAASARIVASTPVGSAPWEVAAGSGSVWVTNESADTVSRIDPKTDAVVDTIPVGNSPEGVAVGGGFVWVANSLDGTVARIDPRTQTVDKRIPVGQGPSGVAFGDGRVWVTNVRDRSVVAINPRSGLKERTKTMPAGADAIAFGAGAVWVVSTLAGTVSRIDPGTFAIQSTNVGNGPSAVAVGRGGVWVANGMDGTVMRVDPTTRRVTGVVTVGGAPSGLAVDSRGSIWVGNEATGTVSRIGPGAVKPVGVVRTDGLPEGIAAAGSAVYVAVQPAGATHRGGTLTVLSGISFDSIDPAIAYSANSESALTVTNDGLVGFARVGGGGGARLVPDLAASLPSVTDGGKTYTFQLRPGIRYSNGALVRPADFRRAIERAIGLGWGGAGYYAGIVGAAACLKAPRRCDLSRGIVADDDADRVTFRLTTPDPDLLYQLALTAAVAQPADTPLHPRLPLPATGPYMFTRNSKHGAQLVRNPRFHTWSPLARPSAYPNQIVFTFGVSPQQQVAAVERNTADLASDVALLSPGRQAALGTGYYASQLHVAPSPNDVYFALNTKVPPFDDVRVRQALNDAFDRQRGVLLWGSAHPSCQVLPPFIAGYRPYCPYTIHQNAAGTWTAPDLAGAHRLVAASGTRGRRVIVWVNTPFTAQAELVVSALDHLGYKARLRTIDDINAYLLYVADSRHEAQVAGAGWQSDYPSPSGFIEPTLSCSSFRPGTGSNQNEAEFCSPPIDAEIARAQALQTTDFQAAAQLWSKIDRDITDQAPWLVELNGDDVSLVSSRVGNYTVSPQWGVLLDRLWVR